MYSISSTLRNRNVHDQLLNPLRKTFLMDLLETFHKLLLELRDGHVYNVFNGALLRALKTPWIRRDMFLINLLEYGRSGLVHGRKKTKTCEGAA